MDAQLPNYQHRCYVLCNVEENTLKGRNFLPKLSTEQAGVELQIIVITETIMVQFKKLTIFPVFKMTLLAR